MPIAAGRLSRWCLPRGARSIGRLLERSHYVRSAGAEGLISRLSFHDDLAVGRRMLSAKFRGSPARRLKANELLPAVGSSNMIYHLTAGWACQFRDLPNGYRAIVDVYLPGDIIGLHNMLQSRALNEVLTLTSVTIEAIRMEDALIELMPYRPIALYALWLLGQRQRRTDRLLAAISCLDARGCVAAMLLEFYTRLRRKGLITAPIYNLPLTQVQIGSYLGLNVVHVNRVLRALRDERIISLDKRCVTILDPERLSSLAESREIPNAAAGMSKCAPTVLGFQPIAPLDDPLADQPELRSAGIVSDGYHKPSEA
jgi:CRP/FNR family transcriptional regulator, anaerobic regulatory protein